MSATGLDAFDERRQVTVKVWLPGTRPENQPAAITLENLVGLRYFLVTLAIGNKIFYNQLFTIVASIGQRQIGKGTYIIHWSDDPVEPMKLDVTNEEGEIEDIIRDLWKQVIYKRYIGT
jgi:hypothetical protein